MEKILNFLNKKHLFNSKKFKTFPLKIVSKKFFYKASKILKFNISALSLETINFHFYDNAAVIELI